MYPRFSCLSKGLWLTWLRKNGGEDLRLVFSPSTSYNLKTLKLQYAHTFVWRFEGNRFTTTCDLSLQIKLVILMFKMLQRWRSFSRVLLTYVRFRGRWWRPFPVRCPRWCCSSALVRTSRRLEPDLTNRRICKRNIKNVFFFCTQKKTLKTSLNDRCSLDARSVLYPCGY